MSRRTYKGKKSDEEVLVQIGAKVPLTAFCEIEEIVNSRHIKRGQAIRELLLRGLAAYRHDKCLGPPAPPGAAEDRISQAVMRIKGPVLEARVAGGHALRIKLASGDEGREDHLPQTEWMTPLDEDRSVQPVAAGNIAACLFE